MTIEMIERFCAGQEKLWVEIAKPIGLIALLRDEIRTGGIASIHRVQDLLTSPEVASGIARCWPRLEDEAIARIHRNSKVLAQIAGTVASAAGTDRHDALPEAWAHYFRHEFPGSPAVKCPVVGAVGDVGFVSDLMLYRFDNADWTCPSLVQHPEIALLPFGSALLRCLEEQWRVRCGNETVCWAIVHREAPGGAELSQLLMDGASLGAAAAAAFFYSAHKHRQIDPKCGLTAAVNPDGSLRSVASESAKIKAAQGAGLSRIGLAHSAGRPDLAKAAFGDGLFTVDDRLKTADEAIAFADWNWSPQQAEPRVATQGIAVLLPPLGTVPATVASVSARLCSGTAPMAQFAPSSAPLDLIGQSALEWAQSYAKKFSGELRRALDEDYLGVNRTANSVVFQIPGASHRYPDLLRAPLAMAVIDAMLRGILEERFQLPLPPSGVLLLCASGFDQFTKDAVGPAGTILSLNGQTFPHFVHLLHARAGQQAEVQQLVVPKLKAIPIDQAVDFVAEVLAELVRVLKADGAAILAGRIRGVIRSVLELEAQLHQAEQAQLDVTDRRERAANELTITRRGISYLDERIKQVKADVESPHRLPTVETIAEEFARVTEQIREEIAGIRQAIHEQVIVCVDEALLQDDSDDKASNRLYRLVAAGLHSDRHHNNPEFDEWFLAAASHRHDRPLLEAMFCILYGFDRVLGGGTMESQTTRYFDQLAAYAESEHLLQQRVEKMRAELEAYGDVPAQHDAGEEKLETAQELLKQAISSRFRELSWRIRGRF